MVNGIREVLRFQAESRVIRTERRARRPYHVVKMITGVKLHPRLGRKHFHGATALGISGPRAEHR